MSEYQIPTPLRELDEIRRLCYIALAAPHAHGMHDLVGTLTNALAHHVVPNVSSDAEDRLYANDILLALLKVVNDQDETAKAWLWTVIDRLIPR